MLLSPIYKKLCQHETCMVLRDIVLSTYKINKSLVNITVLHVYVVILHIDIMQYILYVELQKHVNICLFLMDLLIVCPLLNVHIKNISVIRKCSMQTIMRNIPVYNL